MNKNKETKSRLHKFNFSSSCEYFSVSGPITKIKQVMRELTYLLIIKYALAVFFSLFSPNSPPGLLLVFHYQ